MAENGYQPHQNKDGSVQGAEEFRAAENNVPNGVPVPPPNGFYTQQQFYPNGRPIEQNAQNNAPIPNGYPYYQYHKKSKLAAALLAFTVGVFGVHNFYLGFSNKAVIQLVLALVGLMSNIFTLFIPTLVVLVWSFIEGVQIISNNEQYRYDANGIELKD
ncbi:TM2 domain-containing protein [Scatolibacter rhodanostii]|uniref:TM2 domain-containing protein n=1 Tax=Scatolibacter rhodanostii TaxID=2014781 RepID=UPI001FA908C6|nr:TM2 domain-containing protein [Scatolibacter rhodanostii]